MGTSSFSAEHSTSEVFQWLKTLPVAPEYHPTIQEFQDPISYIFKIENEASKYGICKIVPPVPTPSKKSVISNFNKSISLLNSSKNSSNGNSELNPKNIAPTFTTRQQQVGFCPRKQRPIQKSVWQSGESYTLSQFEAKAKNFEKNYVKNHVKGSKKTVSPLETETLYWRANGDRPFSVEYANDIPGSGFAPMKERKAGDVVSNVGESAWNMRGVARANGSLLKYMKEEIPGVTSPMVYVAMMFSWFAWHVEDHDLHSLNYLHLGSGKTWYGVPRDAALAFEEVIRVHGFGEEINPLVTFATLGQKTTVMSPEVLMNAGVPCCRLVQNAGEFVVTFPRAYHSGFSHGFNCGEASNIATPEWLRFAKDAAVRRASINYPPMVSHFQLLYDLALAIRVPAGNTAEPRSSRLKDKKKGEGEMLVKQMFVQDVMQHNDLLYTLGQGSEVVLLPHNSSEKFVWSNLRVGSKYKVKPGLPFSVHNSDESVKAYDDIMLARDIKQHKAFYSVKAKLNSMSHDKEHSETEAREDADADGLSDRGLFSCVKCGIWTFACVAIVQPTETAAQYLMSSDCSVLKDGMAGLGALNHGIEVINGDANPSDPESFSGFMKKNSPGGMYDVPSHSADFQVQNMEGSTTIKSDTGKNFDEDVHIESNENSSALGLLAMAYGNSSDSEEDVALPSHPVISESNSSGGHSWDARYHQDTATSPNSDQGYDSGMERDPTAVSSRSECDEEGSPQRSDFYEHGRGDSGDSEDEAHNCSSKFVEDTLTLEQNYTSIAEGKNSAKFYGGLDIVAQPNLPFTHECDEDSSRMHVFCLEHAVEVKKQLQPIGGVNVVLLCHPDYPNVQFEAIKVAEELEIKYEWKEIAFTEATKVYEERIQLALQSEEETPKNGDWAVKLGINLFYSAILSRSPLYNKQMPYNSVIYDAFGCKSSPKPKSLLKGYGRQRKITVAGKWCGKVWMSNQVHPLLMQSDLLDEDERGETFRRNPETNSKTQTTSTNRNVGKRKLTGTSSRRVVKKMKFEATELADTDAEDSLDDDKPEFVSRRSVRKPKAPSRSVPRVKRHHEDESPGGLSDDETKSLSRRSVGKPKRQSRSVQRVKHHEEESPNNLSEDSLDIRSHQHGLRSCNVKTKPARKPTRQVKAKVKDIEDSNSEASLSNESLEGCATVGSPDSDAGPSQRRLTKDFQPVSEDEEAGGPSTRLRKRVSKPSARILETRAAVNALVKNSRRKKSPGIPERTGPKMRFPARVGPKMRLPVVKSPAVASDPETENEDEKDNEEENEGEAEFRCDMEGCTMSFGSHEELVLHKRNICIVKGCGKTFFSHKYLVQHRRVHVDERPLKCPWKGCKMAFKWAWARTEHIRVHTGARPYVCSEPGCGQTFRFVSDFSRHKRKTGHSAKKIKK